MRTLLIAALLVAASHAIAFAQPELEPIAGVRPGTPVVEGSAGYTSFFDDSGISHSAFGGAFRVYVLPRVSLGPDVTYMIGPGHDRDLQMLVDLNVDLRASRPGRVGRVEPFLVVGGGFLSHSDSSISGTREAFSFGGGARVWVSRFVYVAPEFRMGWEPHVRVMGRVGFAKR